MIEELAAKVLATRNAAHQAHWKSRSYAQHVALGEFYDGILDAIDDLVESYQGRFGLIELPSIESLPGDNMIPLLASDLAWINENRVAIANGEDALFNLIDNLSNVYEKALYKLRFLS